MFCVDILLVIMCGLELLGQIRSLYKQHKLQTTSHLFL